jgi:hypothetical protein
MVSRLRNAIADSISEVMVAQEKGTDEAIQPVYSQLREFIAAR